MLHDRIRALERDRHSIASDTAPSIDLSNEQQPPQPSLNRPQSPVDHVVEIRTLPQVERGPGKAFAETYESHASPVDGMGAACAADETASPGDKFYGSSSAVSFMDQVRSTIFQRTGATLEKSSSVQPADSLRPDSECLDFQQAELFMLFPRKLTDYLLGRY